MKRFLKPVTGIYEKAAKPYKKLFQEMKMTFDIEIEGRKYRLVGFYPWIKYGLSRKNTLTIRVNEYFTERWIR